jgi:sigma-E factor negative regulatory protein RseA
VSAARKADGAMKENISALMDGELDERTAGQTIEALARAPDALEAWRTYHLISDALHENRLLSEGFAGRVADELAREPTVLAPGRRTPEPRRWYALAAGIAAVALVGWLAFAPQPPAPAPVAQAPQPALPTPVTEAKPPRVPLPTGIPDYLLAHQGYSPRVSLQGMAPYVRTVSEQLEERRK